MKFKSLILLVISLFILFSCDDGIKFDNPNDINSDAYNPSDTDTQANDDDSDKTDTASEYDEDKNDTVSTNDDEPIFDDADSIDDSGDSAPDESDSDDDSADSVSDDDSDSTDSEPDESDPIPDEDTDTDSGDSTPDEDADTDSGDSTPDQDADTDTTPTNPCNPNPCSGTANSTGSCTVSGTSYICSCNSGYFWNSQKCAAIPECSATSGTPCKDSTSLLIWSAKAENTMAWQDAQNYCNNYTEGGLTGWHLPNIDELRTIFIADRAASCQVSETNDCLSWGTCYTCETCSETGIPNTSGIGCSDLGTSYSDGRYSKFGETGFLWSSSTRVDSTYFAWGVRFGSGYVGYGDKANSYDVRCVRCEDGYFWNGQKCAVLPECSKASTTPCADSTSKLTWSKKSTETMAWQDAKNYCNNYTEGGIGGWHLPNIDELRTIFIADRAASCQVSEANDCLSYSSDCFTCKTCTETGIPATSGIDCSDWGTLYDDGRYSKLGDIKPLWSSSIKSGSTDYAWNIKFDYGYISNNPFENSRYVRCVRCEDGYFWNGSICKKQITLGNICTGQSKCYNNSEEITCPTLSTADFYGQDAQYRNKCSTQSFTVKAVSGQNIVVDNNTGLEWQQAISEDTFKWDDAISHCENLSYAGKNDWRLPNPFELLTIIDSSEYAPAINQTYFPIENSDLWSSAAHANPETSNTWKVSYNAGLVDNDSRTKTLKVHCVRGNELKKSTFTTSTINSNVVVNDSVTGLMWQKTYVTGKTWKEALKYCEDLTYAGKSDWRLPNKNELVTLVNYGKFSPASNFPDIPSDAWFWASTTVPGEHYKAWRVYIANGSARGLINKTGTSYVRCVRNAE